MSIYTDIDVSVICSLTLGLPMLETYPLSFEHDSELNYACGFNQPQDLRNPQCFSSGFPL